MSDGLCACGCGRTTPVATRTRLGYRKGEHLRWADPAHARWGAKPRYVEVDTGYSTPCWQWSMHVDKESGYGLGTDSSGRTVLAHRLIYEETTGPIPTGHHLDHVCRNRGCVNPAHLEPVLPRENLRRQPRTVLTEQAVRAIRASSQPAPALAAEHGVSRWTIFDVRARRSWADVV